MADIDKEAMAWVVRQSGRGLDAETQAAFEAWFDAHPSHPGAYLRARAIERALEKLTLDEDQRPSQETLHNGLDASGFRHAHSRRRFAFSAMAAAVAAAVGVPLFLSRQHERVVLNTAKGEFRKVPLADHSVISMNGASRIEVALGAHERRIALVEGEALFEVAKDKRKPFVVDAGGVMVRAVGTAFAVRRFGNGADVTVTEGTVDVWTEHGAAAVQRLSAGDHAWVPDSATRIAVARDPGAAGRKLAWLDGKVVLQEQSLADAVAEFNRYNTRMLVIADPRLQGRKFVGQYRIDQPERFAQDVSSLLGVPVLAGPDRIEIGKAPR
jgi:transmembrane sensor